MQSKYSFTAIDLSDYLNPFLTNTIKYQKSIFDFGDNKFREDLNNLFQHAMEIREVRGSEQFIFFNRITFGLMSILMKLEAKIETNEAREIILNTDS